MKFGDLVKHEIIGQTEYSYIIGVPYYSNGYDDVIVVADVNMAGLVIHSSWCSPMSTNNVELATQYRKRYESKVKDNFLKSDKLKITA